MTQPPNQLPVQYQPPPPAPPAVQSWPLASEQVVISAPMSFAGSAQRLWKMTNVENPWLRYGLAAPAAVTAIGIAWLLITCWYVIFGLFLVPYRLLRRGSRKRTRQGLQHRELLHAVNRGSGPQSGPVGGWYPDPQAEKRMRWWSGDAWTEHTTD